MKRDVTVLISIIIFFISLIGMTGRNVFTFFAFLFALSVIRLTILWFQTFIRCVQKQEVGWALGHVFFVPIASLLYYYLFTESDQKTIES